MAMPARPPSAASDGGSITGRSSSGSFSSKGLQLKFDAKRSHRELLNAAVAWCDETGKGPWQASNEFEDLTAEQIRYAIKQRSKSIPRAEHQILTGVEKERLVQWIETSADNLNAASMSEIWGNKLPLIGADLSPA